MDVVDPRLSRRFTLLADVANRIGDDLRGAGYHEHSYYAVPGGFAIVTRLERIMQDGSPHPTERWSPPQKREAFSLPRYISQLLLAEPGFYRLIVFIVTNESVRVIGTPIEPGDWQYLLREGYLSLPESLGNHEITHRHTCIALIYEFHKESVKHNAQLMIPALLLDGYAHLVRAKLEWATQAWRPLPKGR